MSLPTHQIVSISRSSESREDMAHIDDIPESAFLMERGPIDLAYRNEMEQKIIGIRSGMKGSARSSGNCASAILLIGSERKEYNASSRVNTRDNENFNGSLSVRPERVFYEATEAKGKSGDTYLRDSCAEYMILNHIASEIDRESSGQLILFTELEPCDSCKMIIEKFKKDYPQIKVDVLDNGNKRLKARRSTVE